MAHLIFDKEKYYPIDKNAESVSANGKTYYTLPISFTVPDSSAITDPYGYEIDLFKFPLRAEKCYAVGYAKGKLTYWFTGSDASASDVKFGADASKIQNIKW